MSQNIKLNDLLRLDLAELRKYHIHAAKRSEGVEPLDVFSRSFDEWIEWNQYKGSKDRFNREYIFSMIHDRYRYNKYVFGGIFHIKERHEDWYDVELCETLKPLIGRLVIECEMPRQTALIMENWIDEMYVSEITEKPYGGIPFPGYDNVLIDFPMLELISQHQKEDWRVALSSFKGVYVIADKNNGKKYVGSAYGDGGIWSRWCGYSCSGHGGNDELVALIEEKGLEYARSYFQFSILEILPMTMSADSVIDRENHWKDILLTRTKYGGYNKN